MKTTLAILALLLAWSLAPAAAAEPGPTLLCFEETDDCVVGITCVVNPCHPMVVCVADELVCVPEDPEPILLLCFDETDDCVVGITCVVNPCHPMVVCVADELVCVPQDPEP